MALQNCGECGNPVSEFAYVCPHCGVQMRELPRTPGVIEEIVNLVNQAAGCGCLLVIVLVVMAAVGSAFGCYVPME